jgi:hypothetical protein
MEEVPWKAAAAQPRRRLRSRGTPPLLRSSATRAPLRLPIQLWRHRIRTRGPPGEPRKSLGSGPLERVVRERRISVGRWRRGAACMRKVKVRSAACTKKARPLSLRGSAAAAERAVKVRSTSFLPQSPLPFSAFPIPSRTPLLRRSCLLCSDRTIHVRLCCC